MMAAVHEDDSPDLKDVGRILEEALQAWTAPRLPLFRHPILTPRNLPSCSDVRLLSLFSLVDTRCSSEDAAAGGKGLRRSESESRPAGSGGHRGDTEEGGQGRQRRLGGRTEQGQAEEDGGGHRGGAVCGLRRVQGVPGRSRRGDLGGGRGPERRPQDLRGRVWRRRRSPRRLALP